MVGGELAFDWRLGERRSAYLRFARGYKAGGFNVSLAGVDFGTVDNVNLSPTSIEFDAESLTSIEAGIRASSADGRLRADVGRVRRAARRSAGQGAAAAAARRSVVVLVRDGQLRARRAPRRRGDDRLASDGAPRAVGGRRVGCAPRSTSSRCSPSSRAASKRTRPTTRTRSARRTRRRRAGGRGSTCPAWTRSSTTTATTRQSEPYALANLSVGREWGAWSVKLWVAQRVRRGVLRARFLLRQRAAGFRTDAVHAARRSAPLRHHVQLTACKEPTMRVTAEMSLYPLQGSRSRRSSRSSRRSASDARLEVVVNQMSTQVRGELDVVMSTITTALERSFGNGGSQALGAQDLERGSADRRAAAARAAVARAASWTSSALFADAVAARGGRRGVQRSLPRARDSREPLVLAGGVPVVGAHRRRDVRRAALLRKRRCNVFYAAMAVYGWYQWRYGGA